MEIVLRQVTNLQFDELTMCNEFKVEGPVVNTEVFQEILRKLKKMWPDDFDFIDHSSQYVRFTFRRQPYHKVHRKAIKASDIMDKVIKKWKEAKC